MHKSKAGHGEGAMVRVESVKRMYGSLFFLYNESRVEQTHRFKHRRGPRLYQIIKKIVGMF